MSQGRNASFGLSASRGSTEDSEESIAANMPERSVSTTHSARGGRGNDNPVVVELQRMVADLQREVNELRGAQAPPVQVPVQPASPPRQEEGDVKEYLTILSHMRNIGTGRFRGSTNPIDADAWLESLTRNMTVSRCPEHYKKDIAVFFLERDAAQWWKRVEKKYRNEVVRWGDFQREFEDKYVPAEAREKMEEQFLRLEQGTKSVREYEAEFTRLSQYANDGAQEEAVMIRKFIRGLEPCLRNRLNVVKFQSLHELVERAVLVEEGMVAENIVMQQAPSRPFIATQSQGRGGSTRQNVNRRNDRSAGNRTGRLPYCKQCRTKYYGQCRQESKPSLCYNCRGIGHIARDCPNDGRSNAACAAANVTCFTCGEVGHFATSCPNKRITQRNERPSMPTPPAKRQATNARVFALDAAGPSNTDKDESKGKSKDPIAG